MPSEQELLEALDKDTVDTSRWMVADPKEAKYQLERAESKLYSLAIPQTDGTLRGWHVTDNPEKVIDLLRKRGDFYAREGDLCGGLYVSAVPHFWEGRSQKKWDFLPRLSREARGTLYQAIYDWLVDEIKSGYITQSEFERAESSMAQAMTGDFWQILDIVANQPYNVDIIGLSERLGLASQFKPPHILVDFVGRYLEFNTRRAIEANEALLLLRHDSLEGLSRLDLCNMLKSYGWDGVFTKAGMGTNPELVIWSGDKVVAFGDWIQPMGYEMAGSKSRAVIFDPLGNQRFEADLSITRRLADIRDTRRKLTITLLNKDQVIDFRDIVMAFLEEREVHPLALRARKFLGELGPNELWNLIDLTNRLLEVMQ